MSVVQAKNLKKFYQNGTIKSVKGISFTIPKGHIVALLGANGAGKSTTIKMLTGLLKPTEGSISLMGTNYEKDAQKIKQNFGYVPEESAMYEDIGIFDYIRFFADLYGIEPKVADSRMLDLLKRLDLQVGNRTIGKLSKGMKRKVLIARSLIHNPQLLIYDEPASGLDPKTAHFILEFMKELRAEGKSILFSSHHLAHVEQVADEVMIMHKGDIIENTSLQELVHRTNTYTITYADAKTEIVHTVDGLKAIMAARGHTIKDVEQKTNSLEDIFLELTKEKA